MTLIDELRVLQRELLAHDGWRARGAFVYQAISALEAAEGWRSAWHTARNLSEHIADERDALKAERDSLTEQLGLARKDADSRVCTCHPDDNPPRPCPKKYALQECRLAAALASQAVPR